MNAGDRVVSAKTMKKIRAKRASTTRDIDAMVWENVGNPARLRGYADALDFVLALLDPKEET